MGRLLQIVWIIKTFLTGASAWRYCSETGLSPFCLVSVVYTVILVVAIFVPINRKSAMVLLEEQETLRLRQIEEGLETFTSVEQNGSIYSFLREAKCKWEDINKEKYS
jgi:hypothetical protein